MRRTEGELKDLLAEEFTCKGCGDSFATVQFLATYSRYCPDAEALWEGEQPPTETEQKQEEEDSLYRDGDGEPNEILRHTLAEFPGLNKAVVEEVCPEPISGATFLHIIFRICASAHERSIPRNARADEYHGHNSHGNHSRN